jgi:hypothetical protein
LDVGVYEIVHIESGRRYIGSSKHVRYRLQRHRCDLRGRRARSPSLQNAWNKHGEGAFAFRQVLACRPEDLLGYEDALISAYQANRKPFGYNSRAEASTNAGALRRICKTNPGDVFGRWTVLSAGPMVGLERKWLCRCICGTEKLLSVNSARRGLSKSCGCLQRERWAAAPRARHAAAQSSLELICG